MKFLLSLLFNCALCSLFSSFSSFLPFLHNFIARDTIYIDFCFFFLFIFCNVIVILIDAIVNQVNWFVLFNKNIKICIFLWPTIQIVTPYNSWCLLLNSAAACKWKNRNSLFHFAFLISNQKKQKLKKLQSYKLQYGITLINLHIKVINDTSTNHFGKWFMKNIIKEY